MSEFNDSIFKIVGIIVIGGFLIFIAFKSLNLQMKIMEGFAVTTSTDTKPATPLNIVNAAGSVGNFSNKVAEHVIKLQDTFLIKQYRKDYENLIINSDEYVSYLMLQTLLNIKPDDTTESKAANVKLFETMNTLNTSKATLNALMKFVDSV
jgi:preprotein translocase subunit SecF